MLAAWLLLWFCAMAMPIPQGMPQVAREVALAAVEADCHDEGDADAHHAHADSDHHHEHGVSSAQHCPLCLHAAAPPLVFLALPSSGAAPVKQPAPAAQRPLQVRTDTPPPARAPPRFS